MMTRHITRILACLCGLLIAGGFNATAVTFNEALENNLDWSTGGTANWFATNAAVTPTYDGVDAAASGTIGHNEVSWLETTVTGPGEIRFWWSCSTELDPFDPFIFFVDSEEVAQIFGDENWQYLSYQITNTGNVTLKWEYSRDFAFGGGFNKAYLDRVQFVGGQPIALTEALNTASSHAVWTTGGNANPTYWEGQTNIFRADGKAAESGAIYTSQQSWMETTVWGVTNVSFQWKVSSVTNHGYLAFVLNGATNALISGEVGWQSKTNIAIPWGTNTLRWVAYTDSLAIGKLNRGWVDEVVFGPTFAPSDSIMLSTPIVGSGTAQFNVTNKVGWPCRVYYSTNLAANEWALLVSTNTTSSAVFSVTDPNAGDSPNRYYRAVSP